MREYGIQFMVILIHSSYSGSGKIKAHCLLPISCPKTQSGELEIILHGVCVCTGGQEW